MFILVDVTNPADVRAALTTLPKFLPHESNSGESIEQQFVDHVWSHIGLSMQALLTKVWEYKGVDYTQEKLATDLGRPTKSVRSSMNGPLAKAIKGALEAIPGAPGLFVWKKNANGIWEFGMSQAIKDALARYMTLPMPE
jgi:hypothetical protein